MTRTTRTMTERFNTTASFLTESDDQDQSGQSADSDPDPFLLRQAGGLQLIQVLRELMQVLIGELRQALIRRSLRRHWSRKRRNSGERNQKDKNDKGRTLQHRYLLFLAARAGAAAAGVVSKR